MSGSGEEARVPAKVAMYTTPSGSSSERRISSACSSSALHLGAVNVGPYRVFSTLAIVAHRPAERRGPQTRTPRRSVLNTPPREGYPSSLCVTA